jgi:hypothetical protein
MVARAFELFADSVLAGNTVTEAATASGIELTPCDRLNGFYVYLLIDPRDDSVFYVGKGRGRRAFDHVAECKANRATNREKNARIRSILDAGMEVGARAIVHGIEQSTAFAIERVLIESLPDLTNGASGRGLNWLGVCQRELRKIPSYCVWEFNVLPELDPHLTEEEHIALYWDIIGNWHSLIRSINGEPRYNIPRMFGAV